MSEQQTITPRELRLMIRVLHKLVDTANHITLTGALRDGEGYLRLQFDGILATLNDHGITLPPYFPPLPPDAKPGMLGVAADQLAGYLEELLEPEKEGESGTFFDRFFGSHDFAHIGEAIRGAMPDWMQRDAQERAARPGSGAEASAAASAGAAPAASDLSARLEEVNTRMQAIADQLRQGGLPPEETQRLAAELSRLSQEYSRLAQASTASRPGAEP